MSEDDVRFVILGVIFALAILAAIVAAIKSRSSFRWFVGTLIFPPLLLLLMFLPSNRGAVATPGGSEMPSWTQPPAPEASGDRAADMQAALQRAQSDTDSVVGRRILALAARAAQRAQRNQDRQERRERQPRAPRREAATRPRPSEADPAAEAATAEAAAAMAAAAGKVRKVRDRERQPRRGAVQRSGSRETRIYRRT